MPAIDAILALLDDQDPVVQESLASRLGRDRQLLDRAWEAATARGQPPAALVQLVLSADAESMVDAFAQAEDLEAGVWLLPRLHLPRHDFSTPGAAALDALAERLPPDCDGDVLARILCQDWGFGGDHHDYHNPANSFLPDVLERRVGLPIALTVLWMLVGRRLGLDLEAIAAPGHVIGRCRAGYVDLFNHGSRVSRETLDQRVKASGATDALPYLAPASDRALLRRMARNLVNSYSQREDRVRTTIAHGMATA